MFSGRISNCYDSHVHFTATGEIPLRLNLRHLKAPVQIADLKIESHHFRSGWLIGFGWDQSAWEQPPHRRFLDEVFGETPVVLSRVDGHVYWVNSAVLKKMGWLDFDGRLSGPLPQVVGGEIGVDKSGVPTGLLVDTAKQHLDPLIPEITANEMQTYLLSALRTFHQNGFTHIRDMSCSELQWNELVKLEASGLLTLAIEQTFSAETPEEFDGAIQLAKRAMRLPLKRVRPHAIKVYYDGALGSDGAYLSQPYGHIRERKEYGFRLMNEKEIQECLRRSWELPLPLAVHTIGDQAAHEVVSAAIELWDQGIQGSLFLEHAEVLRSDTIALMKGRPLVCFLQPCHWLDDRQWLREKLDSLLEFAFPWRALEEAKIPFFFGSDSPISRPSLIDNWRALGESAPWGIPPLQNTAEIYHTHPDPTWIPNCYTLIEDGVVKQVIFAGSLVYDRRVSS